MNKATAFFTVTVHNRFFSPCKAALLLLVLLFATNSYAATSVRPAYPGHGPRAACSVPNAYKENDRFDTNVKIPRCASTGLSSKKWGGRYDRASQMYERSVEDPCVAEGLPAGCTYNNAFNPQIRVNYRQCFGIPLPIDTYPTRYTCSGYELIGKTDLKVSECNFNAVNRFCARVAFPGSTSNSHGSYGNRTGVDPDYRTSGTPYSSATAADFKLTNGGTITIASNKVTAYKKGDGTDGLADLNANTYTSVGLSDDEGNDIKTSLIIKKVDAVGGNDPFGGAKSYMVVMPRPQLCAYEDPADMSDPVWSKWSPFHELTPRNSSLSLLTTSNGLSFGENLGVGIGATVAVVVLMPAVAPAAVIIALVALQQSYYNLDVTTNLGCVDIALAPPPPPYPDMLTSPRPLPTLQAICATGKTPEATGCVVPKAGERASSFTEPRIRMGFNRLIPSCTIGQVPTYEIPCITITSNDLNADGTIKSASLNNLQTQLTNIKNAEGVSLPSNSIRPSYDNGTFNANTQATTYALNGILIGSYNDFSLTFGVDGTYQDYRARNPETDAINPNLQHTVQTITDSYSQNRTFFNCPSSDATQICGYELINTSQRAAGAAALCQISNIANPNKVRPVSCITPQYQVSPTIAALSECTSNAALNCSSHVRPLMSVTIDNETLTFGTVTDNYIDTKITEGQTVNPLTSAPSGGYGQCRYLGGMEFCTVAVDVNGDSYEDQTAPQTIVQDISAQGYGYKRGGKKLCLMLPDAIQPDNMVLTKKITTIDADNNVLTSPSTKTADRLKLEYVFPRPIFDNEGKPVLDGNGKPVYGPPITYDDNSPRTPAPDDTTGTVLNSTEALRKRKAAELGYCVDIPRIRYDPCPAKSENLNGVSVAWPVAQVDTTATGACPAGYNGAPTRACTPHDDEASNSYRGSWSAQVTGSCTAVKCPAISYANEGTAAEPNPLTTTDTDGHGNAKWAETTVSPNGPKEVTGTCRLGRNGTVTRNCNSNGTWGQVTGNCTLNRCPNDNVGGCSYHADYLYSRDSDNCGPNKVTRQGCCRGNGRWDGKYRPNVDCRSSFQKNGTNPTVQ